MRIALIAHLAFPISEPFHGGMEAQTHLLARQLVQGGHQVTLFAAAGSDPAFRLYSPQMPESLDWLAREAAAYAEFLEVIRRGGFDVVHNNSLHPLPLLDAHTLGCPVVTTFHSPPFPELLRGVMAARTQPAKLFVAVSQFLAGEWADHVPDCRVIHNSLAVDRWAASTTAAADRAMWIGRICPEKGTVPAIRSARMAGFTLDVAGPIYDSVYFTREVEPLLGGDVRYLGHLDHPEINARASRTAVGLFTSLWEEPFGLVLPEFLACGTPVAGFAGGAAGEILDNSCGVLVPKGDEAALAAAMRQAAILDRQACRRRAETHFSGERMAAEYVALYRELRRY